MRRFARGVVCQSGLLPLALLSAGFAQTSGAQDPRLLPPVQGAIANAGAMVGHGCVENRLHLFAGEMFDQPRFGFLYWNGQNALNLFHR